MYHILRKKNIEITELIPLWANRKRLSINMYCIDFTFLPFPLHPFPLNYYIEHYMALWARVSEPTVEFTGKVTHVRLVTW